MIDWDGKLEAVHTDGTVLPATHDGIDSDGDHRVTFDGSGVWYCKHDGRVSCTPWTIHNVALAPAISPAVIKNMLDRWRDLAGVDLKSVGPHFAANWIETAKNIVAEIEDPDITEARILVETIDGASDQEIALAAIKRGRELASGS